MTRSWHGASSRSESLLRGCTHRRLPENDPSLRPHRRRRVLRVSIPQNRSSLHHCANSASSGLNCLALVMIFLWVPETKQRTLEELDYICELQDILPETLFRLWGPEGLTMGIQLPSRPANTCAIKSRRSFHGHSIATSYSRMSSWSRCTSSKALITARDFPVSICARKRKFSTT